MRTRRFRLWIVLLVGSLVLIVILVAATYRQATWKSELCIASTLDEIPGLDDAFRNWATTGPINYRYECIFLRGYCLSLAGRTSVEAVHKFLVRPADAPLPQMGVKGQGAEILQNVLQELEGVPGLKAEWSKDWVWFVWPEPGADPCLQGILDPDSGWFYALVSMRTLPDLD